MIHAVLLPVPPHAFSANTAAHVGAADCRQWVTFMALCLPGSICPHCTKVMCNVCSISDQASDGLAYSGLFWGFFQGDCIQGKP